MKTKTLAHVVAIAILVALAVPLSVTAQNQAEKKKNASYLVITLGSQGGTGSAANAINNRGWVMGAANLAGDMTQHATLWIFGQKFDLGTLGGPSSAVGWPAVKNNNGLIVGVSDTSIVDPLGEIWSCALAFFPTSSGHTCQGFLWKDHVMTALPTLGGNNGVATGINNKGQAVGWAETTAHDATCNPPQVLQFEAVLYGPKQGQVEALPPLPSDPDSAATAINDKGQVVGISGICANAVGGASATHAVLWESGAPSDIGNLGGGFWNTPTSINNHGEVVGFSDLPGDSADHPNYHAFLWEKSGGMRDLGLLPGEKRSIAWGINNRGQVVGQSSGGPNGSHAFLWQNGMMVDLNTLVPSGSLTLVYANDIDDSGVIVGGAFNPKTGETPGFVAVPNF